MAFNGWKTIEEMSRYDTSLLWEITFFINIERGKQLTTIISHAADEGLVRENNELG